MTTYPATVRAASARGGRRPDRRESRGLAAGDAALSSPPLRPCAWGPPARRFGGPAREGASLVATDAASSAACGLVPPPLSSHHSVVTATWLPAASSAGDLPRSLPRALTPSPPPQRHPPAKGDIPSAGVARTHMRRREPAPLPSLLPRRHDLVRRHVLHDGSVALSAEVTSLADIHAVSPVARGLASLPLVLTASFVATSAAAAPTAASSAGDCPPTAGLVHATSTA